MSEYYMMVTPIIYDEMGCPRSLAPAVYVISEEEFLGGKSEYPVNMPVSITGPTQDFLPVDTGMGHVRTRIGFHVEIRRTDVPHPMVLSQYERQTSGTGNGPNNDQSFDHGERKGSSLPDTACDGTNPKCPCQRS